MRKEGAALHDGVGSSIFFLVTAELQRMPIDSFSQHLNTQTVGFCGGSCDAHCSALDIRMIGFFLYLFLIRTSDMPMRGHGVMRHVVLCLLTSSLDIRVKGSFFFLLLLSFFLSFFPSFFFFLPLSPRIVP